MHTPRKSLKSLCEQEEVWGDWLASYKKYVPRFIEEARTKTRWEDWDKEVFYNFFERAREQCVASLQQGYFSNADKQAIKAHWDELAPLLRTVAENQTEPQWDVYRKIKNTIRKYTKRNMRAATHRLVASLQPQLLCTVVEESSLWRLFCKLKQYTSDGIPEYTGGDWFRNSCGISRLFQSVLQPHDPIDTVTYPWQMLEFFKGYDKRHNDMNEYVTAKKERLESVRNLIFTGAPGTGKTYLAKQIAMLMTGANSIEELERSGQFAFVQFHPSYDYTDFVEGLRPTRSDDGGTIGFELKDGIFKEFCTRAREKGSMESLDKAIEDFKVRCASGTVKVPNRSGYEFSVTYRGGRTFRVRSDKSEADEGRDFPANIEAVKRLYRNDEKGIYNITYVWGILEYLKKTYGIPEYKEDKSDKKYVFLIDEINRGEISRIFGELFFSIDPCYRGPRGAVETQYSNMHDTDEKFYVPENVYIIGTMNDIDRSVESFDFAMRRRFAWDEITAAESADNMNLSPETKGVMEALNKAISDVEGLDASFHVGGAYFLDREGSEQNDYESLWEHRLAPLLKEYLRGMPGAGAELEKIKSAYDAAANNGQ